MAPGSVLLVHTTCSPRTVDRIAEHAGARGVEVVDAGISGGPQDVDAGTLTLFVGGDAESVARVRPVLSSYGDPVLHLGPRGAGQRVKLLNNAVFAAHLGLLAQAVAAAAELGVPEPELLQALRHGSGASRALDGVAHVGSVRDFVAVAGEFIGKDLDVVRAVAAELDLDLRAFTESSRVLSSLHDTVTSSHVNSPR